MDQMKVPAEVVTVTAAPNGHVILGVKDREGDTAAVVLSPQLISVLAQLLSEGFAASVEGREYFKGIMRPVLERPEASKLN